MSDDFDSYFGSYKKRSPHWHERAKHFNNEQPGLVLFKSWLEDGVRQLEVLNKKKYPKIYSALQEECNFRGVEVPACYVDSSNKTILGIALSPDYSIIIDHRAEQIFNEKEMRALVAHELKHLYQGKISSKQDHYKAEYDCDKAAVESTDYETIRSYVHKAINLVIEHHVPTKALKKIIGSFHRSFPNLIAESAFIPLDAEHPSPGSRMWQMYLHERKLKSPAPSQEWMFP